MKLNKKSAIKGAACLSALLVTGVSFSAPVDKESISMRCERVYNTLDKMVEEQRDSPCASDVQYAGWVMQGAAALVNAERYSTALKNLRSVDLNLTSVYLLHGKCAYFAPKVKPSLDEVHLLINELENMSS